jgi:hypothetical protein
MFTNTEEFRREALHYLKHGYYCADTPGSVAYYEYWQEQLRRCREGYSVGGMHITGHHYFYLNFCQIKLTRVGNEKVTKNATKIVSFPDFWDGDWEFFTALQKAREEGKHVIVGKARRKGFSYKNSAIAANTYNTIKNSYTLLCAHDKKYLYPKGIMTMTVDHMNFLNENTAWSKRRQAVDKQNHKRASFYEYINGQPVERGYKSEVEAITFKDNPDAARGKDATLVIFEECGAFDNLKDSFMATKPTVEDGGITTGQMILFGTGGDMEGGTIDFESMFYNPDTYNLYAFDNIWDEGAEGTSCGFFFPDYKNKVGYMDNQGNSLVADARLAEEAKRENIKRTSKDAGVIDKHVTEYPFNPKEAFLQKSGNVFPTASLVEHRNNIMRTGVFKNIGVNGYLVQSQNGVKFKPNENAIPVLKFPHDKGSNVEGCIVMYQTPYTDESGQIPDNMYIIVHDPYAQDGGSGKSLGAAYVIKRVNPISKPDDMIVASYVGRPQTQDEFNHNLFLLAEYFNARIGFENDRGEVVPYAKRTRNLKWLLPEAEIFSKSDNVSIRKLGRTYGTSMGSKERKGQAEIYLRDWLRTPRGVSESGEKKLNLHYIYDLALLDELIKYNRRGNFDRVSALLVGMFHLIALFNRTVEQAEERSYTSNDSFFNRELFT